MRPYIAHFEDILPGQNSDAALTLDVGPSRFVLKYSRCRVSVHIAGSIEMTGSDVARFVQHTVACAYTLCADWLLELHRIVSSSCPADLAPSLEPPLQGTGLMSDRFCKLLSIRFSLVLQFHMSSIGHTPGRSMSEFSPKASVG